MMTREESVLILKNMLRGEVMPVYLTEQKRAAVRIALTALRPVSRERVEKAFGGCKHCGEEWGTCNPITNRFTMPPPGGIRFCPMCGAPLTDEAVQMVMDRLEALYE